VAYKAQTTTISNSDGGFSSINNSFLDSSNNSTGSAGNSAATPSSVYMPSSVALSRDNMSDLSGVSGGTSRGHSTQTIPGQIFDPRSLTKPWKQAYVLSKIPPERNASIKNRDNNTASSSSSSNAGGSGQNGDSSIGGVNGDNEDRKEGNKIDGTSIWVAENDVVEIFDSLESSLGLDRFQITGGQQHNRIPIMVLLMNPPKQNYELMQIWVDRANDSIRDLVQVLQHKLPVQWKQAYDGLFQVRGPRFTQLINIIRLVKYDIQPHEVLVAKPWAMSAKVTIAFAGSAIRHLTHVGVITADRNGSSNSKGDRIQRSQPKNEDTPLLLSKRAQDRAYFPEGILNHHHAMQFITFSPPFESSNNNDDMGPAATTTIAAGNNSASDLSTSHDNISKSVADSGDDPSSSLLGSGAIHQQSDSGLTKSLLGGMRGVNGPLSRRQKTSKSFSKRNDSPNNNTAPTLGSYTTLKIPTTSGSHQKRRHGDDEDSEDSDDSVKCGELLSKLNCFRKSTNMTRRIYDGRATQASTPTSLSEEEEKQWLAYSMKPIVEDQSLIGGGSVISMSAPLLSQNFSSHLDNNNSVRKRQPFRSVQKQSYEPRSYGRSNRAIDNECDF